MRVRIAAPLVVALLASQSLMALPALASHVTREAVVIAAGAGGQYDPAIKGDSIAFTDTSTGDADIVVKSISTSATVRISGSPAGGAQEVEDVDGNYVVFRNWIETDNDGEIFVYNLETGVYTQITTNNDNFELDPVISGNRIAWVQIEAIVTEDETSTIWTANVDGTGVQSIAPGGYQIDPAISGNTLVWNEDFNVVAVDITIPAVPVKTTIATGADRWPDVNGTKIAYGSGGNIYVRDGATTTQLTNDTNVQRKPKVSDTLVAWEHTVAPGDIDVKGWDFRENIAVDFAVGPDVQELHDLDGTNLAFTDRTTDNAGDIYLVREVPDAPLTLVVNSTADPGSGTCDAAECTLREAINAANAHGNVDAPDAIHFNIPAASDPGCNAATGVCTIRPFPALPVITDPVIIDGYTQPGASANTLAVGNNAALRVELTGTNAGGGLQAHGLRITAGSSTVRGLVINRFAYGGIRLEAGGDNTIAGNFIGTDQTGSSALGNFFYGVGVLLNSANNAIGGTTPEARNLISGNHHDDVTIQNASGNVVRGNYLGTNAAGITSLVNGPGSGVYVHQAPNNVIGGTTAAARNVIGGQQYGIFLFTSTANGNVIQSNYIGVGADGTAPLPNAYGIYVAGAVNTLIGGATPGAANTIGYNGVNGVFVASGAGNGIRANAIFASGALGIDLAPSGVTPNDAGDGDGGANTRQNFPVITSATSAGGVTVITGTLNSTANSSFALDFFDNVACDPSGHGEGERFIGTWPVATDNSGNGSFVATFSNAVPAGRFATATATNAGNNTSEFSQCRVVTAADLAVDLADSPDPVVVHNALTYTATVSNNGPATATAVRFVDTLPAGVTFVSANSSQGSCTFASGVVTCDLGTVAVGATATVTIEVVPTVPGTITNAATVTGAEADPDTSNNSDVETTTVLSAEDAITDLIADIEGLGELNEGQQNSLIVKLEAALTSIEDGNLNAACGQLGAFINEVNALVGSRQLDAATGSALIAGAEDIRTAVGCP